MTVELSLSRSTGHRALVAVMGFLWFSMIVNDLADEAIGRTPSSL